MVWFLTKCNWNLHRDIFTVDVTEQKRGKNIVSEKAKYGTDKRKRKSSVITKTSKYFGIRIPFFSSKKCNYIKSGTIKVRIGENPFV